MKKELYQKGVFPRVLASSINTIKNSDTIKIDFNMPKEEYAKLENKVNTLFRKLNNLLFEYTISDFDEDKYAIQIKDSVESIIAFLNNHFDLENSFYEDKLNLYKTYFIHYPKKLANMFTAFEDSFKKITNTFVDLASSSTSMGIGLEAEEYYVPIQMYNDFHSSLYSANFYPKTKEYMIHCAELLLKDVYEMFTNEVLDNKNPNENRIRKIVYLLKTELDLDVD